MKRIVFTFTIMMFAVTVFSQQIYNIKTSDVQSGKYEQYYGTIKVSGEVLNGLKVGAWVESHPNTDLPHFIIQYKDGKKDGLYLEFDKQGGIVKKIDYNDDLIDGLNCVWNRGGRMSVKQEYQKGKLNGKSTIYYDNGFIQEESYYKDGKRHGVTMWYSYADKMQGVVAVMYTYMDGLFEGVQETYYEDGSVKTQKMFSNNVANGPAVEYYEDGSVKSESNYKNGELKGKVKEYKKGERFAM